MSYFGIPIRNGLPIGLGSVAPLASGGGSPFSPLSLFSGGAPGAWYDPSDLTTLFQDSAGTTPVTAVEQPVGLMLDKSQGLVLGPELVPNGDFSNGSANWTTGTGWSISGGSAQGAAVAGADLSSSFITTSGRWYQFTFTVIGYVAGIVRPSVGQSETINVTANGTYTYRFLAASPTAVKFFAFSAFTGTIDNISVKELAGNHAFQSTSASRPVLSARYNLLTKTEQFDNAAWTVTQSTKTPAQLAPDGTNTAVLVTGSAGNNVKFLATTSSSAATSNTFRFYVKNEGANFLQILYLAASGTSYANFNISTGTLGPYSGAVPTIVPSEYAGWSVITFTETTNAANSGVRVCIIDSETAARNSTTTSTGSFTLWHPSFVPANQSTLPYQRVNTATDYNTTGFLPYLKFDGVDDSLSTNSISFTSTDKMSVFAGVRKLNNGTVSILTELSTSSDGVVGTFAIGAPVNTKQYYFQLTTTGAGRIDGSVSSGYDSPRTDVVTYLMDIGGASTASELNARINGSNLSLTYSGSGNGTGNFGNEPLFIGRRANSSLPFNGQLYGLIIVGKAVTAGELSSTETYVNQKTGAY